MIELEAVIADLQLSTSLLLKFFSSFDSEDFNKRSTDGSWTPGEIAEHLLRLDIVINRTLQGSSRVSKLPWSRRSTVFTMPSAV